MGHFDPLPERTDTASTEFVYYGPEGETVLVQDADAAARQSAEAALYGADYFGAYARGPYGRSGVWVGAFTPELARAYALANCGEGCRIVAERLPLNRDDGQSGPVATRAMAENLAVLWPFTNDYVALGGAGAWGHRTKPGGRTGTRRAMREAAADCEVRRAAEGTPSPDLSPPCRVQRITEFIDLRPKPTLYPAAFTIAETRLYPVEESRLEEMPDAPASGWLTPYLPPRLYGARAATEDKSYDVVRAAGWPEAGMQIALAKCTAQRRPGEGPCRVTHRRVPDAEVPDAVLAVRPELYEAFVAWEQTRGPGAFAISPYGPWGFSYEMKTAEAAVQKAADWCWYYTRRNWEYRQVNRAFLDPKVECRIVAIRRH